MAASMFDQPQAMLNQESRVLSLDKYTFRILFFCAVMIILHIIELALLVKLAFQL